MSGRDNSSPRESLALFASLIPRAMRATWAGGILLAAGLAVTAVWALSTARLYRSETVLVYERGVQSGSVGVALEGDSPRQVGTRLQDTLLSRQRLDGLIKQMNLYPRIVDQRGRVEAIEEMRKHIVLAIREGYTFRVSYDAESREQAQAVLDRLVKGVVEDDTRRRLREAEEAKRFLDTERRHADEVLKAKEATLAAFLTQHPQLAAETGANGATAGGLIRAADRDRAPAAGGEIASLELQAAQLEEALASSGQSPGLPPPEPGADPVLVAARARAATELQSAQRELAEKQARFTNEHPDVKAALRHVADSEAALRHAESALAEHRPKSAPVAAASGGEGEGALGRTAALRRALAAVRAQIGALRSRSAPPAEVPHSAQSVVAIDTEWTRITRDVSEARERQSQLEAKQFQAQLMATLAAGGQGGRLVIADPPFRPMRPVAGGRFKIALLGGVASLLLALLAVAIAAAFDDRLYAARDVQRVVTDAVVVVVPRLTRKGV